MATERWLPRLFGRALKHGMCICPIWCGNIDVWCVCIVMIFSGVLSCIVYLCFMTHTHTHTTRTPHTHIRTHSNKVTLQSFRGIVFVGGFSYADALGRCVCVCVCVFVYMYVTHKNTHTCTHIHTHTYTHAHTYTHIHTYISAKGWAALIKNNKHLNQMFQNYYKQKNCFSLGVCNGCQLMALLGWIPFEGVWCVYVCDECMCDVWCVKCDVCVVCVIGVIGDIGCVCGVWCVIRVMCVMYVMYVMCVMCMMVDVCDVWCVVWCVMCDMWCVMCYVLCVMSDTWYLMCDVWCVMYDVWYVNVVVGMDSFWRSGSCIAGNMLYFQSFCYYLIWCDPHRACVCVCVCVCMYVCVCVWILASLHTEPFLSLWIQICDRKGNECMMIMIIFLILMMIITITMNIYVCVQIEQSPSIMFNGMEGSTLGIWVAHGEGRAFFPDKKM